MRMNSLGWVVVVLAVTLTIWNFIEYERNTPVPSSHLPNGIAVRWHLNSEDYRAVRYKYIERGVLIVGVAVAAWLIVGRRERRA
jgi:hypothetical protein